MANDLDPKFDVSTYDSKNYINNTNKLSNIVITQQNTSKITLIIDGGAAEDYDHNGTLAGGNKDLSLENFENGGNKLSDKVIGDFTTLSISDTPSTTTFNETDAHTIMVGKPNISSLTVRYSSDNTIPLNGFDDDRVIVIKVIFDKAIRVTGGKPRIKIVEEGFNFNRNTVNGIMVSNTDTTTDSQGNRLGANEGGTTDKNQTHWKYTYRISRGGKIGKIIISDAMAVNGLTMDDSKEYNFKIAQYPLINILKSFDKNKNIGPTADNSTRISRFKHIHRKTRFYNNVTKKGERTRLWGHNQLKNRSGTEGSSSTRIYFSAIFPRMTFR